MLKDLAKLADTLMLDSQHENGKINKSIINSVHEALYGPWTYLDQTHPLGWDPNSERDHAFRAQEPESDKKNRSVRFAVWLAHFALSILPSVPDNKRLRTTAFVIEGKASQKRFRWPLWSSPIGIDSLTALLTLPQLVGNREDIAELHSRGITAVFESYRHDRNQGFAIFRPARLIPPAAPQARRSTPAGPLVF